MQLCYSNNGLAWRQVADGYQAAAGEVLFAAAPSAAQLGAAFPNYATAAAAESLAQQAIAMLSAGCQIASTSTPALDGTYAADATRQAQITSEIASILLNGTFADGSDSIAWPDVTGAAHAFTVAQFKAFATAIAAFVSAITKVIGGQSTTLPAQPSTIA